MNKRYGDKVLVTHGFYEGLKGVLKAVIGNDYLVVQENLFRYDSFWVKGEHLSLLKRRGEK